jgi:hypothetical protein
MMNYNRCNGCKRFFYIGGSMVKGVRRVCRMRVGHYDIGGSDSDCVGLFDFVMAHYADDIALMRLNLWNDTGV